MIREAPSPPQSTRLIQYIFPIYVCMSPVACMASMLVLLAATVHISHNNNNNNNNNNNGLAGSPARWLGFHGVAAAAMERMMRVEEVGNSKYKVGVNWGTQASHKLPASTVVKMLEASKIGRVKLFEVDDDIMGALLGSHMEVMVAIPNRLLPYIAARRSRAAAWVRSNVARYVFHGGVRIKYVAVGNEPFLRAYNGSFVAATLPALQNVQWAVEAAGLGDEIKATVPCNADVLASDTELPSEGRFREDIAEEMGEILGFLQSHGCPFTVNIYPFLSLYDNYPNFPVGYAFFDHDHGSGDAARIIDGELVYENVFEASYDTLVAALERAGGYVSGGMGIIVGEIGWPTDGFEAATLQNARRFNQGFLDRVVRQRRGTPRLPNATIHFYLFSLLDEDQKSIDPGNFERHWGIYAYDGIAKYPLIINPPTTDPNNDSDSAASNYSLLANAQGVTYLPRRWCILSDIDVHPLLLSESITYACSYSDCTSLSYGSSCNAVLDARGNASYAFNMYFQINSQVGGTCNFDGLASITFTDPSISTCHFIVQLATSAAGPLVLHHLFLHSTTLLCCCCFCYVLCTVSRR